MRLFGEPEVRFSAVGPAIVMPMIIGAPLYFGDQIDAKTALDLGMINRIVPLAELGTASLGYAKRRSLISTDLGGWTCLLAWPMAIPGR
jgi:enoyl-CoA hydratase/carnithine racemase